MNIASFLVFVVNIKALLPCILWLFPELHPPEWLRARCCLEKRVGPHTYHWVNMSDDAVNPQYSCMNRCVYRREDEENPLYCFKTGHLETQCTGNGSLGKCGTVLDSKQQYKLSMAKVKRDLLELVNISKVFSPKFKCFSQTPWMPPKPECFCKEYENEGFTNLNTNDVKNTMEDVLRLILVILNKEQKDALKKTSACSEERITCDKCFISLTQSLGECIWFGDSAYCEEVIKVPETTCKSCFCHLSKKCNTNAKCKKDTQRVTTRDSGIKHPCDRICTEDGPRQCIFNLTLEIQYSDADGRRADGRKRPVLTYNGQLPGPTIVICEGDKLVVNLTNSISGNMTNVDGSTNATTLHFHGISERTRPWADGVPWVTQCPILPGENFTYGFTAENYDGAPPGSYSQEGTYWYHSHVGAQRTNGAYGTFIIRPKTTDDRFDVDETENTIIVQEWYHSPTQGTIASLLINGRGRIGENITRIKDRKATLDYLKGQGVSYEFVNNTDYGGPNHFNTNYTEYNINQAGKRYIFRIIGAISQNFPLQLSIEDHTFTAIAADAQNIRSVEKLTHLWVASGERFDIVVETKKENISSEAYKIKVVGFSNNNNKTFPFCTIAWLKYPNQTIDYTYVTDDTCSGFNSSEPSSPRRTLNPVPNNFEAWKNRIKFPHCPSNESAPGDIFINDLRARKNLPSLPSTAFGSVLNTHYIEMVGDETFNKRRMIYPDIPFLLQNPDNKTDRCGSHCSIDVNVTRFLHDKTYMKSNCSKTGSDCTKQNCLCQHVLRMPYAPTYWVELVLINNDVDAVAHPIHLHGGWFWVAGMEEFGKHINKSDIRKKDRNCPEKKGCLPRNLFYPPAKDTIQVPPGGYVILMVELSNKGTWLLHCHLNFHFSIGMAMVLQIGGDKTKKTKNLEQHWCAGNAKNNTPCATQPPKPTGGPAVIRWFDDMKPAHRCVKPGNNVTFYWDNESTQKHNVNLVNSTVFNTCKITNHDKPGNGDYHWTATAPGTYYFVCGTGNGWHCLHGNVKATIDVSNHCT